MPDDPEKTPQPAGGNADPNRRDVLTRLGVGACAVAAAGSGAVTLDFLNPKVLFEPETKFRAGSPARLPRRNHPLRPRAEGLRRGDGGRRLRDVGRLHAPRLHHAARLGRERDRLPVPRQPLRPRRERDERACAAAAPLARGDARRRREPHGRHEHRDPARKGVPDMSARWEDLLLDAPEGDVRVALHRPPRGRRNEPQPLAHRLREPLPPRPSGQGPGAFAPLQPHLLARRGDRRLDARPRGDRRPPDVLLPPLGSAGLPRHEGARLRRRQRPVSPEPPPLVGAPDGLRRDAPHAARLLPRRLPAAASVQLGDRRRSSSSSRSCSRTRGTSCRGTSSRSGASRSGRTWPRRRRSWARRSGFFLLGGNVVSENALLRFYVLHCVVLPVALVLFVAVHIWRIRKDGGVQGPREDGGVPPEVNP